MILTTERTWVSEKEFNDEEGEGELFPLFEDRMSFCMLFLFSRNFLLNSVSLIPTSTLPEIFWYCHFFSEEEALMPHSLCSQMLMPHSLLLIVDSLFLCYPFYLLFQEPTYSSGKFLSTSSGLLSSIQFSFRSFSNLL